MIDGIGRMLARLGDSETWDVDQELKPEPEEATDLNTPNSVLIGAGGVYPQACSEVNAADYYKDLLRSAIDNGGKYSGHHIPVPWLRMVLAGLEWKRIDPETMWDGFETDVPSEEPLQEIPSYNDLFPSD